MLNLLYGYIENSLPEGALTTAPGLQLKADARGRLLPFEGNTVKPDLSNCRKNCIAPPERCFPSR